MRTSRSMGGKRQSTWDTGDPIPAVRCKCHTIRVWPHQITFLYMRFSKWNRALTLFTPEQRWGQDGSSAGWKSRLEMGGRWGITSISHIPYPSENRSSFISLFTGLEFHSLSVPRGGSHLTTGQWEPAVHWSSSLGKDCHAATTAAAKLRPGLQVTEFVSHCPYTYFDRPVSMQWCHSLSCSKQLMASNPPKSLNKRAPRLYFDGEGKVSVHDRTPHISLSKDHVGLSQQPLPGEHKIWLKHQSVSTHQCVTPRCWTKPVTAISHQLPSWLPKIYACLGPNTFKIQ